MITLQKQSNVCLKLDDYLPIGQNIIGYVFFDLFHVCDQMIAHNYKIDQWILPYIKTN